MRLACSDDFVLTGGADLGLARVVVCRVFLGGLVDEEYCSTVSTNIDQLEPVLANFDQFQPILDNFDRFDAPSPVTGAPVRWPPRVKFGSLAAAPFLIGRY